MHAGFNTGTYQWEDGAPTFLHDALGEAELWWQHWGKLLGGPRRDGEWTDSEFDVSSEAGSRKPSLIVEYSVDVQHHISASET